MPRCRRSGGYSERPPTRKGLAEYDELIQVPIFRDFVALYVAEGYKRCRNTASVSDSDPAIVSLAARWLGQLSGRAPVIRVQHHLDQDVKTLRAFWADTLGVDPDSIQFRAKSNSGQLRTRVWRCAYGVVAVDVHDTQLRARIQAWIDRIRESWG